MITGQMLYLEEDLHKLLDMARRADIAPPTTLRHGRAGAARAHRHARARRRCPTSAIRAPRDLAIDLERFLHSYSPVFTANKLSTHLRQAVGDPVQVVVEAERRGARRADVDARAR